MKRYLLLLLTFAILSPAAYGKAHAATCSFSTAPTALAFGTITNRTPTKTTIASIRVICPNGTPYTIGLANPGTISNGSTALPVQAFQDAAHTKVWGNTVGTNTLSAVGTGGTQIYTVYGVLTLATMPPPGTYTNNITANLNY